MLDDRTLCLVQYLAVVLILLLQNVFALVWVLHISRFVGLSIHFQEIGISCFQEVLITAVGFSAGVLWRIAPAIAVVISWLGVCRFFHEFDFLVRKNHSDT